MRKKKKNICLLCMGIFLILGLGQSVTAATENKEKEEKAPEIMIGCDEYEPYIYFDENGNLVGIDADLSDEAFSRMGYTPVYVLMKWTEKDIYLDNGMIDCIWDSYSMNGAEDKYLWSEPYMYSREAVVVDADSSIQTLNDLNDKKISTLVKTRSENILLEKKIFPHLEPEGIYSFQYMNEALATLKQGYVDAAAGDRAYIDYYMENYAGKLRVIDESLETSRLAVAFPKGTDQKMVDRLNETLRDMKLDGTTDEILKKYGVEQITSAGEKESE